MPLQSCVVLNAGSLLIPLKQTNAVRSEDNCAALIVVDKITGLLNE